MPSVLPPASVILPSLETLLIAAAGGIALASLGIPAGLVSGSVLAVAIAALAGRPMQVPTPVGQVCFVLVGILLGAIVTPETLKGMATWPLSIAVLAVATIAMIAATTSYLRFVHRWDWASAFLGASPGAMAQVVALAAEFKADVRGIAIVQVMRVLLIVIGLPGGLALFGLAAGAVVGAPEPSGGSSPLELAILVAVSTALALLLRFLKFPGGLLFGAMAASAILHGTGLVHAVLPWWLGGAAVVVVGAIAGSRFANTGWRTLADYLGAALGSFAVAVAVAAGFAALVMALLPFRPADVIIAFVPGAQDQMMLLALALTLDPVYVGAHHLSRWLICTFSLAIFGKSMQIGRGGSTEPRRWKRPGRGMSDD
ncbi:MAG: AbrB family transcriptional regulator [Hyphomicrobiales bacterium]|nr:AbrB family transcriptional regulator [Hyphomicrobiales bacterium]